MLKPFLFFTLAWMAVLATLFIISKVKRYRERKAEERRMAEEEARQIILSRRRGLPLTPLSLEDTRHLYLTTCLRRINGGRAVVEQGIATNSARISYMQKAIAERLMSSTEDSAVIEEFSRATELENQRAAAEFDRISANDSVNFVRVREGCIDVGTKPIHIEHEGKTLNFGEFVIRILLDNSGRILIAQTDGTTREIHPHVDDEGVPWLSADLKLAIIQFLAAGEIASVVEILIGFLQSYDEKACVMKIEKF